MKTHTLLGIARAFALTSVAGLAQAEVIAITHPSTTIPASDLRDIFTGEKQFAGAVKLVVVDNSAAQGEFLSKALKMDKDKYGSIWTKKGFRDGLNPPATKSGDAEVIEFVKRTPGAVGYVGTSAAGVNVIGKF